MAFVLTFLQVDKRLRQDGFELTHVPGSHHHYKHPESGNRVVVPRPSHIKGNIPHRDITEHLPTSRLGLEK